LKINKIRLNSFKNYDQTGFGFHDRVNVISGNNGIGKTNLLDAVYYLCLGRSYFTNLDSNVIAHNHDWFRLEGDFEKDEIVEKVAIVCRRSESKTIEVAGVKYKKMSDHLGAFPAVMIAPLDIQILMESSENRRKFINNTLIQISQKYLSNLLVYNRLLNQRNALLKQSLEKGFLDLTLIESIDRNIYQPAQDIYEERQILVSELSALFDYYHKKITGDREAATINYVSKLHDKPLSQLMKEALPKDKILGRTTRGIHKDDLEFIMDGRELKKFASQGQLKSFVIALKLAQFDYIKKISGKNPLILLDDIFAKLDDQRVHNLIDLLYHKSESQLFITDTSEDRLKSILENAKVDFKGIHLR